MLSCRRGRCSVRRAACVGAASLERAFGGACVAGLCGRCSVLLCLAPCALCIRTRAPPALQPSALGPTLALDRMTPYARLVRRGRGERGVRPRAVRAVPRRTPRRLTPPRAPPSSSRPRRSPRAARPGAPSAACRRRVGPADVRTIVGAVNLAESIRRYGHLGAQLDPLGTPPWGDPSLAPEAHGITEADLRRAAGHRSSAAPSRRARRTRPRRSTGCAASTARASATTSRTSSGPRSAPGCGTPPRPGSFRAPADPVDAVELLDRITEVETFERFLHRTFPGKTRFSIEGLDMLVPILDELIADSADAGVKHVLIGMAHRGRLNVLAHVLQKGYAQILGEFKDAASATSRSARISAGRAT